MAKLAVQSKDGKDRSLLVTIATNGSVLISIFTCDSQWHPIGNAVSAFNNTTETEWKIHKKYRSKYADDGMIINEEQSTKLSNVPKAGGQP